VDERILELAPATVGKRPGRPVPQELITALLVSLGGQHRNVVRLKGGDPYVFGRGGEEALGLREAAVPFDVVPGVSAALAAPALAGVPVTHRGVSGSVTVVTGHRRAGDEEATDWHALAKAGGTIVVLMGVAERATIAGALIAGGRSGDTPVAIVERAGTPDQRVTRCRLAALDAAEVAPPATIVIGPVAALDLRNDLPLHALVR
jgi:uroporphyrin-III C-methyltransferase